MRLMLLRHAKSSLATSDLADIDRPLNTRGRSAASRMGQFISTQNLKPHLILCSSAQRARETLALLLPFFDFEFTIKIDSQLYHAGIEQYQMMVRDTAPQHTSLMIIGHNPTIETYARMLAQPGSNRGLQALAEKFPTCGLAVLEAPVTKWPDFMAAQLSLFQVPRSLDNSHADSRS